MCPQDAGKKEKAKGIRNGSNDDALSWWWSTSRNFGDCGVGGGLTRNKILRKGKSVCA